MSTKSGLTERDQEESPEMARQLVREPYSRVTEGGIPDENFTPESYLCFPV